MILDDPAFMAWCRRQRVWVSLRGFLADADSVPWACDITTGSRTFYGVGATAAAAVRDAVEDALAAGIDPPEGWGDVPSA